MGKLKVSCKEGHKWEVDPDKLKQGRWCPKCAHEGARKRMLQFTILDCKDEAKKNGGICLDKVYESTQSLLNWKCNKGHKWKAPFERIKGTKKKKGSWCPVCAGNIKGTLCNMKKIAMDNGGRCLSETYIGSKEKLKWICKEGHRWDASPIGMKKGDWCPICTGRHKRILTIDDMKYRANLHSGKCLSKKYVSAKSDLRWECRIGHTWTATADIMKRRKRFCTICKK